MTSHHCEKYFYQMERTYKIYRGMGHIVGFSIDIFKKKIINDDIPEGVEEGCHIEEVL